MAFFAPFQFRYIRRLLKTPRCAGPVFLGTREGGEEAIPARSQKHGIVKEEMTTTGQCEDTSDGYPA